MRGLASAYGGPWDDIRATLEDPARVNSPGSTPHVVAAPWNRGRAVVIGDAAHCCPPTLAQGAAQALEDAAVLAELLLTPATWTSSCGTASHPPRRPGPAVVEASDQLADWLIAHEQGDVPGLMHSLAELVGEPA